MGVFEELDQKETYILCFKLLHTKSLKEIKSSRWFDFFGPEQPVKGCWRYLYKLPINKRTGDLQCRIIHGAIATNKHVAHIDPYQSVDFPFCSQTKHWYIRFVVATGWDFCSIYRNNGVFFGKNVFLFLCLFLDQSILSIRNKNKCWWILSLEWLNFLYGFQGRI